MHKWLHTHARAIDITTNKAAWMNIPVGGQAMPTWNGIGPKFNAE